MRKQLFQAGRVLGLSLMAALIAAPSFAEKPEWAGGGGKHGDERRQDHGKPHKGGGDHGAPERRGPSHAPQERDGARARTSVVTVTPGGYFAERQRTVAREYYGSQFRAGKCPPGLAKKANGCLPPGQAKKWAMGKPLPRDVVYYSVPQAVVLQLGVPPAGHRYVRVAADILLIAIGTNMVMDAIQDLSGR